MLHQFRAEAEHVHADDALGRVAAVGAPKNQSPRPCWLMPKIIRSIASPREIGAAP
jgi:hypothetical protein